MKTPLTPHGKNVPAAVPALLRSLVAACTTFLLGVSPVNAATYEWALDGAGTWNDDTNNWATNSVPINGDRVVIDRANGATVAYDSTNFSGTNRLVATADWQPALVLGGSGGINILQIGTGDTLQFDAPGANYVGIRVNNGGQLNISGGTVEDITATSFVDSLHVLNGGSVSISGNGVFERPGTGGIFLANTAGHSASLTVSGSGQFTCPDTTASSGGDFNAQAGNSTVSVSDSGLLRVARDLLVGTSGGTHNWTLSGGTLERAGAIGSAWLLGNNNGSGSVTFNQTGGTFSNSAHSTRIEGTAQYAISGDPASVTMVNGTLRVDGTLNQSGGYVNNAFELYVGNTAGQSGQYTATAGNLRTRGLHIADVADSSGTLTLNAGVTYTNYGVTGSAGQRIAIGATSGAGTGTFEIKGLNNIANGGGGGFTQVFVNETGVIKGYGTLSGYGPLQMNGRVIADGYGTDQTLALGAGNDPITNTVDNTSDKGYYAVNQGTLTLKAVNLTLGTSGFWGESADADGLPDLINSFAINNPDASVTLTASLLDPSHNSLPAYNLPFLSVWDIDVSAALTADFVFRFNNVDTAADLSAARLLHYDGSSWIDITSSVDAANGLIYANAVDDYSYFAVSVPEPSTYALLALAAGGVGAHVIRRRRR